MEQKKINKISKHMIDPAFSQEIDDKIGILSDDISSNADQLTNHESRLSNLENGSNTIVSNVTGLYRGQAWLILKQQASDRIEGGVAFADNMSGDRFGFVLNEAESQNIKIRDGKMLMIEDVEVSHSATDEVVVNQAYSTAGNGGRKIVRLDNGWIVVAVLDSNTIRLYVDKRKGSGFEQLCFIYNSATTVKDFAIAEYGRELHVISSVVLTGGNHMVRGHRIDPSTVLNENIYAKNFVVIDTNQTDIGNVSLAIDPTNGHLHAAWTSKNSTYPNGFNIRYARSVDEGKTWSSVEQLTTGNSTSQEWERPSVILNGEGKPIIISSTKGGSDDTFRTITSHRKELTNWVSSNIYLGAIYNQTSPSAVVDKDGVIHVAWHGTDSTGFRRIMYSKSIDSAKWSSAERLTLPKNESYDFPSITVDRQGNIFVVFHGPDKDAIGNSANQIYLVKYDGNIWGSQTRLTNSTIASVYPSTLYDPTFSITFGDLPIMVNMHDSKIIFNGEWTEYTQQDRLTAKAVYDIPSTDFVGAFVEKTGDVEIKAFLNDEIMDSELENDEYQFEKKISSKSPTKLRIELSRTDVLDGELDGVTRILGGRS